MFQRERDPIFFRDWFCAGREDEIPMNAVKTLRDEA
jgi:hypothetical protein